MSRACSPLYFFQEFLWVVLLALTLSVGKPAKEKVFKVFFPHLILEDQDFNIMCSKIHFALEPSYIKSKLLKIQDETKGITLICAQKMLFNYGVSIDQEAQDLTWGRRTRSQTNPFLSSP